MVLSTTPVCKLFLTANWIACIYVGSGKRHFCFLLGPGSEVVTKYMPLLYLPILFSHPSPSSYPLVPPPSHLSFSFPWFLFGPSFIPSAGQFLSLPSGWLPPFLKFFLRPAICLHPFQPIRTSSLPPHQNLATGGSHSLGRHGASQLLGRWALGLAAAASTSAQVPPLAVNAPFLQLLLASGSVRDAGCASRKRPRSLSE